ncbi:MAG TPA: DNA-binding transcriptional regulator OxyR [Cytophagales bacterium]|nr:DNA-binding transcriptional regulator OxyR [Cytophagales bacterium]HAA18834.1 DNA-binding transcriptional regulator OxyR [Cytophagales bacterium]HAP60889.1 DNA-binding transcriptional regulator OxyR [Cytophagales bacterium]
MTITQLEYIIAVDTHRHFAKAARECHVTQPTLSMQIQKLEDQLGIKVFDRSKQPVVPTEIGTKVINQARLVVNESKKIREMVEEEKEEVAGDLRLGIIPTLAPYLVPRFVASFLEQFPKVRLHIEELLSTDVLYGLKHGKLDVGIMVTPTEDPSIYETPLFYEPFQAYVSPRHSLFQATEIKPGQIHLEDIWLLQEGHCFRNQVLNLCGQEGNTGPLRSLSYESGSLEALKRLVDRQSGLTLLPQLAALDLSPDDKKKLRTLVQGPVREVSMVMHRSFLKKKMLDALSKEIVKSIPPGIPREQNGEVILWNT